MVVETVRMSSKGQIVIPLDIREDVDAGEGTLFAVVSSKDAIILKKLGTPSREDLLRDLQAIAKGGRERLSRKGIRESDIPGIVANSRKKNEGSV